MQVYAAVAGCAVLLGSLCSPAQSAPAATAAEPSPQQNPAVVQFGPPPDQDGLITDTQGVDLKPYVAQVFRITQSSWKPLMPREVEPPFLKSGTVVIRFKILSNGHVKEESMVLESKSGDPALDRAAWGAIATSVYAPIPVDFKGSELELRFRFEYNRGKRPAPAAKTPKARGQLEPLGLTLGYTSREWH